MTAFDEADLERVIRAFAHAAVDPSRWLPAMTQASDLIGAVCCALELADTKTGKAIMVNTLDLDEEVLKLYQERIFHINPRVRNAMPLSVGFVADDRHLMSMEDPNAPEFLDWLEKTPYHYIQGTKILDANGQIGFYSSNFAKKDGPPDEMRERLHRSILPHVINFHEVGRALSANKMRNELVTHHALDGEKPFALLDHAGRLIECSAGFEAILRSSSLIAARNQLLSGRHPQHRALVASLLKSAVGSRRYIDPPSPIRLTRPTNPRGLVLRAIPLSPQQDLFDIFRPAALITLVDLDAPMKACQKELAALFGLTDREADVAALIGEGYSIARAADVLIISQFTVKQHLKSVFGKMCIERQSDLVRVVSRLA